MGLYACCFFFITGGVILMALVIFALNTPLCILNKRLKPLQKKKTNLLISYCCVTKSNKGALRAYTRLRLGRHFALRCIILW